MCMIEKEIGSNFHEIINSSINRIEDSKKIKFLDSGRSAISIILEQMNCKDMKVLLPIYTCESVIKPFVSRGCEIRYYKVDEKLEPDKEEFKKILQEYDPKLVYVHSYFGFDTLKKIRHEINELCKKDTLIVEDITHSMFSKVERINADFYLGSLRKWCSLPDGGVIEIVSERANTLFDGKNIFEENTSFLETRLRAQKQKEMYFNGRSQGKDKDFIQWFDKSEEILEQQGNIYTMSNYSRERIESIEWDALKKRRSENYRYLVDKMDEIKEIEAIFPNMSQDVVPLYCPVYVKRARNELRVFARKRNIMLPVIWPIPPEVEQILGDDSRWVYEHILAIPCDQRYTRTDMETIISTMKLFFEEA